MLHWRGAEDWRMVIPGSRGELHLAREGSSISVTRPERAPAQITLNPPNHGAADAQ